MSRNPFTNIKRESTRKLAFLQKGKDVALENFNKHQSFWQKVAVEPKIDGIRAVYYEGKLWSYTQKPIYNCERVESELKKIVHPGEVIDGELYGDSWEYTQSIVMSSVTKKKIGKVRFRAFDCIPLFEFNLGVGLTNQSVRYRLLGELLSRKDFKYTIPVPRYRPNTYRRFLKIYEQFIGEGYEGAMVKQLEEPYLFYKGNAWMKCKHTRTEDVTITELKPGKGKYENSLGSFICIDERGNQISVAGMDDETRKAVWKQKRKTIGRIIEVKFFKLTKSGKMYSAHFLRWRDDK